MGSAFVVDLNNMGWMVDDSVWFKISCADAGAHLENKLNVP